ncbi:TPA: hypothetical protein OOF66_004001 [Morganella morganii]|uniref:hypothetical protein n=1 Tax=Morganella morganii TaxID=582 RepID=UPI001330A2FB|nr:hypothetical protein [Morganella morganii]HCR4037707.1 hypothetical protein [Morganella morganii]HCR4051888.1 hypothetical protein [Morganella morganii]
MTEAEQREHYEKVMGIVGKVVMYTLNSRGDIIFRDDLIDELRQHKKEAPTKEIKALLNDAIKMVDR